MPVTSSDYLKALALDTRIRIIELLKAEGTLFVTELAKRLKVTTSAVSQHLKMLRLAGLVKSERKGFYIAYSLDHDALKCCQMTVDELCSCSCCRPPVMFKATAAEEEIETLKNYERNLNHEISSVRRRIKQIQKKTQ